MIDAATRARMLLALVTAASLAGTVVVEADETTRPLRLILEDKHAEGADLWIYNDIEKGMDVARKTGKPLFVTFRCVPCSACAGFDAEVARGSDVIEKLARERFVAVRQVEMKGVDLSLFQFDYDLNWAALFVNADGVVYARYGTQSARGPDAYNSIAGLEKTMRRVLELHEVYPANRAELESKRGPAKPYRTALEMPGLEKRGRFRGETTRRNCIHCHNIHDAEQLHAQDTGAFTEGMLWRYPLPDNIGLVIDPSHGLRVRSVIEGSAAESAGLESGEDVTHINGQVITSIADMQWALHHLPSAETEVSVRASRSGEVKLKLGKDWKKTDFSWRGSLWSLRPRMRVWTPELDARGRRKHGITDDRRLLEVRWINREEPGGRAAFESGLRQGDVIVALAGKPIDMKPVQFHMHMKLNYKVGDTLPLTVLRDGKRLQVDVKLVE